MVGWFAKAAQVWRRPEPPPPQTFDVACACGHRLSGARRPTFQTVPCDRCGTVAFVLPQDVYPKPKPKKAPKTAVARAAKSESDAVFKASGPVPEKIAFARPAPANAAEAAPVTTVRNQATLRTAREETAEAVREAAQARGSIVTPFRLIGLALAGVILATGYFVWQVHLKTVADRALPTHVAAAEAAMRERDIGTAAREYQLASEAVDRLGRQDSQSLQIRQKAKELHAIVNLSPVPLYEICEQAHREAPAGEEKWTESFNRLYRNAWIVVEGDVMREPLEIGLPPAKAGDAKTASDNESKPVPRPVIRYPFPIDEAPVVLDAKLAAIEGLDTADGPRKVIFAGQLESLTKEGTKNPVWVIRLHDKTAFAWVDFDTYQMLGLVSDDLGADETRRILNQQAQTVGIKP
jgi:hypothetical protein